MKNSIGTIILAVAISGCGPKAQDTLALIHAGSGKACATDEVRDRLRSELTWFLRFNALKPKLTDGTSTKNFGYLFDPIVATSSGADAVACAASAYLTLDGRTPMASNTIPLTYWLHPNLTVDDDFVLSGQFADARETSYILYQNVGAVNSPPSLYGSKQ